MIYNSFPKDSTIYGWHFEQNVYLSHGCIRALKASEGSGNIPKIITDINNTNNMEQQGKPLFDNVQYERTAEGRLRFFIMENGEKRYKRLRIRKLTPRECFRLMDVDEHYIDTIQAVGISKSQQYKLAGNSIVVNCM
ncbi:MAG: DNA cytosine methyltransferase [Bacteroidaceae bacterium]|nr:DNA cytosine methyltransferase [Bacteroidaceae bacterium]